MTTTTGGPPATSAPSAGALRSLRVRNFRLFFVGQLISQIGTWMTMVTQTLLVLSLTGSGVMLGLLTAFQFGPVLLLGAWAGLVADRADKHRLLMRLQGLSIAPSLVLGVAVLAGWTSVPLIFAIAATHGTLLAFESPTRRSFVVEMVPATDLPNAVSLNSAVMTGARMVGPALAGILVLTVGYGWTFIIDATSYLAVLTGLAMMRRPELHPADPTAKGKGQVREGLRYIASDPRLLVPLAMTALVGTFAFNFPVTLPLLIDGPLGGDTTAFTWMLSVTSLGSFTGALLTARRTRITSAHVVGATGAFGVATLALAATPNLAMAFPLAVVLGLSAITFMTSATAIVQLAANPVYRGRVLAIQSMVFLGSKPIGGPILGWVADTAGPRAAVALGAVACLVATAYGARALAVTPWRRDGPTDPPRGGRTGGAVEEPFTLAD